MSSIEKLQYHLVFCVKYRYHLLRDEMVKELKKYIFDRQDRFCFRIESLAIEQDHVHLLFSIGSSKVDVNRIVKNIKGGSSFVLRHKFIELMSYPFLWTPSHFLATVGEISKNTISEYINNQGIEEKEKIVRTFVYKVGKITKKKDRQLNRWLKNILSRPKGLQSGYLKEMKDQIGLRNDLISIGEKEEGYFSKWLNLPGGNGWKRISIPISGRIFPQGAKLKDSKIIKKNNQWFAHLAFEEERIIKNIAPFGKVLSLDLGISRPITKTRIENEKVKDVEFLGKDLKQLSFRRIQKSSLLQEYGKKNVQKYTNKITRSINNRIHQYTNSIVKEAKHFGIAIICGNLRGITKTWNKSEKKRNKTFRKKAKSFPYAKIMSQLFYKGVLNEVQVVFQNEAYTSKRCSRCGKMGLRIGNKFSCSKCKYVIQADLNGSVNIAKAYRLGLNDKSLVPLRT